jgi:hypothetical protein
MTLHREVTNDTHVHRLVVTSDIDGWEVREEEDGTVLHRAHRHDWHRVEMDPLLFELKTIAHTRGHTWARAAGGRR